MEKPAIYYFTSLEFNQAKIITNHALLYSNYAERKAIITERLRWRERLITGNIPHFEELQSRLKFLRYRSQKLRDQKKILLMEHSRLKDLIQIKPL